MALTLAQAVEMDYRQIEERYAQYRGKRIPCLENEGAYHLNPHVAERHCRGVGVRMISMMTQVMKVMPLDSDMGGRR